MYVRLLKIPDGAIRITERSEAPEGATIYEGDQGGLAYLPAGEDNGEEESKTDREQEVAEIAANAEPNELAGCLRAAISPDDVADFDVVNFRIGTADTNADAQAIIEEHLSEAEIDKLAEEVALQEQMRQDFDAIDSVQQLQFGQEVLIDGAVPVRGVFSSLVSNTVFVKNDLTGDVTGYGLENEDAIYADEPQSKADLEPARPGQFGMASSDRVLSRPFDYATEITGSREAGIESGNTTGEDMKVLTMSDDTRVFATPLDAYEYTSTGVVDGPVEARINNKNSPKVINALGGLACKTEIVDGPGDRTYIAKEGIDGELLRESSFDSFPPDELVQSAKETRAAAYFVGNVDLHSANLMVTDDNGLVVIDHDSAGKTFDYRSGTEKVPNKSRYKIDLPSGSADEQIYDNARDIRNGDVDLSDVGPAHTDFAQRAAEKATRAAVIDPSYDVPSDEVPEELEMIDGFEDKENWPEAGEFVAVVDLEGDIVTAMVEEKTDEGLRIPDLRTPNLLAGNLNRVVEVL